MDFYILAQQLINGITLGAIYGLIAVGYTMVYGVIRMINFAHGDVYMVSAYIAAITLAVLGFFGVQSVPFALISILIITCAITAVYGWVIERVAYRPLRGSTKKAPQISAIGITLNLQIKVHI
jgi:branched-chain amino acid transport system permease protein